MSVRIVTSGNAATKPPNLSLRFANSDTSTTTAAVMKYLVKSQDMEFSLTPNAELKGERRRRESSERSERL
jgi:hypothetical protein